MARTHTKQTKRGFVMTGGGAKGLFEAGVIHAFHLCGMEFDAITGSSIGAINSIFYAEYLLRKRQLPAEVLADPARAIEAMDPLVRAFLHAWWEMPRMGIIDDTADGPLGKLKDDLQELDISLASLVRILWWYTDPADDAIPDARVLADVSRLINELTERFEGGRGMIEIWRRWRDDKVKPLDAVVRTYLNRFGMEHALVPDDKAERLRDTFTQSITPLQSDHLEDGAARQEEEMVALIPVDRTLRDFKAAGIDVRLTRTNFRTGRLEVSAHNSAEDFAAFLRKHWFRFDNKDGLLPALGTARLQTIGNPNAVNAALASGRFPGVFSPMPIRKIYDLDGVEDSDNVMCSGILAKWLNDDAVQTAIGAMGENPTGRNRAISAELLQTWQESEELARLFPRETDHYVDGGAIDNTPTNSAIDAVKDWADERDIGYREILLDLYTIFLHPPPDPGELVTDDIPSSIEVVRRTMEIRTAAILDTDAAHVRFVNKTGQLAEDTSRTLIDLSATLEGLLADLPEETALGLTDEQKTTLRQALEARLSAALPGPDGDEMADRLRELRTDHEEIIDRKLPLHVNPIEIHPEEMPMRTLQFTERLGYRPENAIRMMTSGCYSTLWSVYAYLGDKDGRDAQDDAALMQAQRWMGLEGLGSLEATNDLRQSWRCQQTQCVFHARHCRHGASPHAG